MNPLPDTTPLTPAQCASRRTAVRGGGVPCVHAVAVSRRKGIPKSLVDEARLLPEWGIEGDAHAGAWHRQISLLAVESIDSMRARGLPTVRPGAFAENITTEGLVLTDLAVGSRLRIGEAVLEITQIGKECHTLCAIAVRAGDCVMPREGIFARVIEGGMVRPGDPVLPLADAADPGDRVCLTPDVPTAAVEAH